MGAHSKNGGLVLWRYSDGKAGHDAQSKGLTQALANLTPCKEYEIEAPHLGGILKALVQKNVHKELPNPDLIIGAGHKTHLPLLTTKHCRGGKTIVLMRPSLPLSWFDYCIIPKHDNPPAHENIIPCEGPLNTITPSDRHDHSKGLILIGGPSKHFGWDENRLANQIHTLIENKEISWTITDSRRTPQTTRILLTKLNNNIQYMPYEQCQQGWLNKQLAIAGQTWVTEDSLSMIYESLTAGAQTGLLTVPKKRNGRITRAIESIKSKNLVATFDQKIFPARHESFHEAARCAEILLQKLN